MVETLLLASLLMYGVGLMPRVLPSGQQQNSMNPEGLKQQLLSILLLLLLLLHLYAKPMDPICADGRIPADAASSKASTGRAGAGAREQAALDTKQQQVERARPAVLFLSAAAAAAIAASLSLPGLAQLAQ